MIFRDRPMDWFVYQGYAYQILVQQSLRGGENYFYFMPGARYVVFLTHILFGNNDVLIGIIVVSGFIAVAISISWRFITELSLSRIAIISGFGSAVVLIGLALSSLTVQLALASSSEIFAWGIFLVTTANLKTIASNIRRFVFGSGLGLVVFLRPNYLVVALCVLLGALLLNYRDDRHRNVFSILVKRAWLILGFVLVSLLALSHNVYYSETFGLFTNRADPSQTVFEPARIFNIFSDEIVRDAIWHNFRFFFYWQLPNGNLFQLASWFGQGLWCLGLANLLRHRHKYVARGIILSSPILYVLSTAPFGIMTIPERQTTMATLALTLSAVISISIADTAPDAVPEITKSDNSS